ncbi:MAG TPA: TonB family protein, partial [Lysobacter sp.]
MAQTLALRTDAVRIGRLDFTRIWAEAAAIAVHGVALLLLLVPMNMYVPPVESRSVTDVLPILPEKPPTPPRPPEKVEIIQRRVFPAMPTIPQPRIELQQPPIVDPLPDDVAIDATQVAKVENSLGSEITEPLVGVHLEYEIAPPPPYPVDAIRRSLTGTVLLRVLVDVDGKPIDVRIERSSGHRVLDT